MLDAQLLQQRGEALFDLARVSGALPRRAAAPARRARSLPRELAEDRGFLRQVGQAQARARWIGMCATGWPSMRISPPSLRTRPTIM
jgi:hypothetical protein